MTLPTNISDIEDLYQVLEAYPHWKQALRRQLLTPELLAMPETLAQLTEQVNRNSRQIADNSQQIARNSEQINRLSGKIDQLTEQLAENSRQLSELRQIGENHTTRMARMESDNSELKSLATEARAGDITYIIAAWLDWEQPIQLNKAELTALTHNKSLARDVRASFIAADLIFQARDNTGKDVYCAVEISWTVNQYDIDRARRNAEILESLTGRPSQAAVCGERYDWHLNWKDVLWIPRQQ